MKDRGSAVPFAVAALGMLLLVGCALGVVGAMFARHRTSQAAADLGSLAAASALQRGADACDAAADIVAANGAVLAGCQVVGSITGDLTRTASPLGETTMGDVIADAQLEATSDASKGGSVAAFMNIGGVRGDLIASNIAGGEAPGQITYGESFTVQPFGNTLVVKTLTGAQIKQVLEQQYAGCFGQTTKRVMQISSSLKYEAAPSAAACDDKIGQIWIKGTLVDPTATYRVTMNNFMSTGGDGFTTFNQGTNPLGGAQDIDALNAYLGAHNPTAVPALDRIVAKP